MPSSPVIFAVCALATVALVLGLGAYLGPRGWLDLPSQRKRHGHPVPRVGGLALVGVLATAKALGWLSLHLTILEWCVVLLLAVIGILDDRFNLRARWKAFVGFLLALPLASVHTWELLHNGRDLTLFGFNVPEHAGFYFPLLMMWYWAIPQAFNLIDGMNGLCLGFSCLLLGALCAGPSSLLDSGVTPLWGTLTALLLLNYPRARHFLGDTGSLALGGLFSILVLERALPYHRGLAFWLIAYPILDVTMVVLIRAYTRRPLGQADRNHIHHWLQDRFNGQNWIVTLVLLALAGLPMLRGVDWGLAHRAAALGLLALSALALVVFVDRALLRPLRPIEVGPSTHGPCNEPSATNLIL